MAYFDIPVTAYASTSTTVDLKSKDVTTGTHGKVASTLSRVRDEPRVVLVTPKSNTLEMAQHRDTIERIAKAFTMP